MDACFILDKSEDSHELSNLQKVTQVVIYKTRIQTLTRKHRFSCTA